jgi:hypothetical protein
VRSVEDGESDPGCVGVDPVRRVVGVAEAPVVDPTLDLGASGAAGGVEGKLVTGQERDELRPIAHAIVDSYERDLH